MRHCQLYGASAGTEGVQPAWLCVSDMGAGKSKAQMAREVILVGLEGSGKTTTLMQAMHGTSSNLEVGFGSRIRSGCLRISC